MKTSTKTTLSGLVLAASIAAGVAFVAAPVPAPERSWTEAPRGWIAADWDEAEAMTLEHSGTEFIQRVPDGYCVQTREQFNHAGFGGC